MDQRRTSSCSIVSELLLWLLDLGSSEVLSLFSVSDRSSVSIWYWEMTGIEVTGVSKQEHHQHMEHMEMVVRWGRGSDSPF